MLQNAVLGFWAWWTIELATVFSPLLHLVLPRRSGGVAVRLARVPDERDGEGRGFFATLEPESWQVLARKLEGAKKRSQPLILDLTDDLVLRRRANYPASAIAKLDDIIALDIEKSAPFTRQSAVWKWRVVGRAGG